MRDLVLDHIGISRAINENWNWQGRVAVAEYEAQIVDDSNLNERDRHPSDHRPVVVGVDWLEPIGDCLGDLAAGQS